MGLPVPKDILEEAVSIIVSPWSYEEAGSEGLTGGRTSRDTTRSVQRRPGLALLHLSVACRWLQPISRALDGDQGPEPFAWHARWATNRLCSKPRGEA